MSEINRSQLEAMRRVHNRLRLKAISADPTLTASLGPLIDATKSGNGVVEIPYEILFPLKKVDEGDEKSVHDGPKCVQG